MSHYTSLTPDDLRQMLTTIGVDSVEDLFAAVPEGLRMRRPLDLPAGLTEQEVVAEMRRLAARNVSCDDEISFVGAGMYDHYVPAIVDTLLGRAEFLTPYTPYQPEVSQGGLQVMFEYQTAISELTGLPVSNAGLYDGPSALASAGYLARLANGRGTIVVSRGVHPHSRMTLGTYADGFESQVREVPLRDGVTDPAALADALDDTVGAVILQSPNVLGAVEDLGPLVAAAKAAGALAVVSVDPMTLGILRPPGDVGADIAVGEGQPLGNRLDYGGPSFGFFAARTELIRQMPGRIAGETTDADGRRGFVLTLQTREQHIRREKATSNICTAQALNALAAMIHLSWLGRRGIVEIGELMLRRADYARRTLSALPGVSATHDQPIVREFALTLDAPVAGVVERCAAEGVNPGYPLGNDDPEHDRTLLVAITEQRSRADIDRLADVLGRAVAAEQAAAVGGGPMTPRHTTGSPLQSEPVVTIYERSREGRRAWVAPDAGVPEVPLDELLPAHLRRDDGPRLPEVSEPEIVRHFTRLSKRNFDLDSGFYPLGSCTMKHNPRLHERVAALPGNARLHPLQNPARAQGALELMWRLERALSEVAGLPHVSLQPSAGSHGELAGVLVSKAYHEDRNDPRTKILIPDTAHGTNPATVTMGGYETVKVGTNDRGGVDLEDLRRKTDETVACLMLTNPNTLGLFDPDIEQIARIVHDAGATLYYDGANLNAVMGISRPGDMGFDIVHFNLHKSFTQPHGGGGPGSGPIAVSDRLEPFLPVPRLVRHEGEDGEARFDLENDRPKSIGRLRGFQGNYGVFVRSFAYILSLGAEGLREASEIAVLNANYLRARILEEAGDHLPAAFPDSRPMHEFVLSGAPMRKALGVKTENLAKRLLDYGYHPPTVYFPLLVEEALLVEPTETETKETLDGFADAIGEILREAAEDPETVLNAPFTTPVRRLDQAKSARNPVVRQVMD